jgi:hypothetical protein
MTVPAVAVNDHDHDGSFGAPGRWVRRDPSAEKFTMPN